MSVIGVGQALRNQTRAAEATRSARSHLGEGSTSDLAFDSRTAVCAGCASTVARGSMIWSDTGEICPECQAQVPVEDGRASALDALVPIGLALPGVGFAWVTVSAVGSERLAELFSGKGGVSWMVLLTLTFVASGVAVLLAARRVAGHRRAARSLDGAPGPLFLAMDLGGLSFTAGSLLAVLFAGVLPFVI